ncbi:MAG: sugar kinase [Anaerolineae bacterium]
MYDLVSLGEVMLRMAPPKYERLQRMRQLDVEVAGAQLNVAANMARFGKNSAFLSRLPDNALGVLAYDTCAAYGVDMQHVKIVAEGRMGINFLEFTATPRVGVTIFDRRGSAASTINVSDFDWEGIARQSRIFHTDGIMPGLSSTCREATLVYLRAARDAGCITSFDVNYREHLWTAETARECWEQVLPLVDVVVTSRSVSETVFGFGGTDAEIMQQYQAHFGHRLVCLTHRK